MKARWFIPLFVYLCLVSTLFAYDWAANPGDGSEENPYQISTPEQMHQISFDDHIWDKCFELTADLHFDRYWYTINNFYGCFDGKGHVIYCEGSPDVIYRKIFNRIEVNAVVRNLVIFGGEFQAEKAAVLAWSNYGKIENCSVTSTVVGTGGNMGGLVLANHGEMTDCHMRGTLTNLDEGGDTGGLVGWNMDGAIIKRCSSHCAIEGNSNVGGLVGVDLGNLIQDCYVTGSVHGRDECTGYVGGLAGLTGSSTIINCYSTAVISTDAPVSTRGMGGLASWSASTFSGCYWDTQTSGVYTSEGGFGKTTAQMQDVSLFQSAGWDFETVWYMDGYPILQSEINPLQARIDAASDGDVVTVQPGVYEGKLNFKGKNITLTSMDPMDPAIVAATVLLGSGNGSVVTFAGTEDNTCVLTGFTITGGFAVRGGGICGNASQAEISYCVVQDNSAEKGGGIADCNGNIEKCIITGNSATANGGGFAFCAGRIKNCLIVGNTATVGAGLNNSDGTIVNCTIADNMATTNGGGLRRCDGAISNCIIWSNAPDDQFECPHLIYSCYSGASGKGNIDAVPLFTDSDAKEYYLREDSPCIDAGDPTADYSNEPQPNGGRINMGVYGNTAEAAVTSNFTLPQSKILPADGEEGDMFGSSVSIDGDFMVVGASGDNDYGVHSGSAYIYYYDGSSWVQQVKLTAADTGYLSQFGNAVSIDGEYAIAGAPGGEGSAYIFHYDGSTWSQQAKLISPNSLLYDCFGSSVSISGKYAIVGAYEDSHKNNNTGSAYIFHYDGLEWVLQEELRPLNSNGDDYFGYGVSIDDDVAIVAASLDDESGYNSGAAYVFRYDGSSWACQAKLMIGKDEAYFGGGVVVDGDYAIIGALGDGDNGDYSGSAYVFHYNGSTWTQQTKLVAEDGSAGAMFGGAKSIDGEYVIVGVPRDDNNTGSAYVFQYDGSSWNQRTKLTAADGIILDYFGNSVDVSNGIFVVGAYNDDDNGTNSGSVFVFGQRPLECLSVSGLELVSKQRISRTVFEYVYRLAVSNSYMEPISDVVVTLLPECDNMTVIDGQVVIAQIAAYTTIVTDDTITVQVDRTAGPAAAEWLIEDGASTSRATQPVTLGLQADIIADGIVNEQDLMRMVQSWLMADSIADIVTAPYETVNIVNLNDLRVLSEEWKK